MINIGLVIVLTPLFSSLIMGLLGFAINRKWIYITAISGIALPTFLSFYLLFKVFTTSISIDQDLYTWLMIDNIRLSMGFLIDQLTVLMLAVVTFISLMVHVYTIGYMQHDEGYKRFFSYISLFTFAMLTLVISNNFVQLFFGWEAVGVVSYLLIGFWFKRESPIFAGLKAFLVNRVGDLGFLLGIGLIAVYGGGSLHYATVFKGAAILQNLSFFWMPGIQSSLITAICLLLFWGAMAKSAQFPLHVWLPDSMEGPTPISALIHAATMVTAGIFMVCRISPLFELSDTALNIILVTGSITALSMGLMGMIQNDIKRVIAYSTLSQLGYMTVALGASIYSMAIFHVATHAFFKALLFLAAGSVIIGMHHEQDIRHMGNLREYMPVTWLTFLIGSLSLIGMPFFSGFYSKDAIIEALQYCDLPGAGFAWCCLSIGVLVTSFYTARMYFMVFHGPKHWASSTRKITQPHEKNWSIKLPLLLLAIPSIILGYLAIPSFLQNRFFGSAIVVDSTQHMAAIELSEAFHGPFLMGIHGFTNLPTYLVALGIILAWFLYIKKPSMAAWIKKVSWPLYTLLENKYYLDALYSKALVKGTQALGQQLWKWGEIRLIDGLLVNGCARFIKRASRLLQIMQTGYIQTYAFGMILGLLILLFFVL